MNFINLEQTDDPKVQCGYCSNCGSYNEVWKDKNKSICFICRKEMIHIKPIYKAILLFLVVIIFISCFTF